MSRNVISWVEIPVKDMERAKQSYSSVFKKELNDFPMPDMEMAVFPGVQGGEFAMGSLVKSKIPLLRVQSCTSHVKISAWKLVEGTC